jgi:prephenate dehydrogenase
METLVVGPGAMGRWFGETVDGAVAFADVAAASAEAAASDLGGRTVPIDSTEPFDVVCVAVPMGVTEEAIAAHAPQAESAIVDLSGIMAGPVATMAEHAPDRERASFHPLFAPDNAPGRIAAVVDAPGPTVRSIREALESAGNAVFDTTPEEHDTAMETVQARTHAALLAFVLAAEEVPEPYGTPIYDGLAALAEEFLSGTPRVYADIQTTFEGAADVAAAAERVAEADAETFSELYRQARE